jgi:hypothetical protein
MRRTGFLLFLPLVLACTSFAQTSFRATVAEGSKQLIVETRTTGQVPPNLVNILSDKSRYRIFQISVDDPEHPGSTPLNFNSVADDGAIFCNTGTGVCLVNLRNPIAPGNYVIKVDGLGSFAANSSDAVPIFFGLKPPQSIPGAGGPATTAAIVSSIDGRRNKVRVQSKSPITANPQLNVNDTTLRISPDKTKVVPQNTVIPANVEDPQNPGNAAGAASTAKEFTVLLDNGLSKARTHNLNIPNGIVDSNGAAVKTEGSVEIPGLPKPPDALNFELRLSSEAANHVKPFFNLSAKYDAQDQIPVRGHCFLSVNSLPCYWQPQIAADVGLGETKSKNSIVVDLPFRSIIYNTQLETFSSNDENIFRIDDDAGEIAIPTYYGWKHTPLYRGDVYFFFGPKFESDRRFARVNALGSLRLDFRMHRLLGSIAQKRGLLSGGAPFGLSKQQLSQVEIKSGFSLVPTIGVDFGRKVTAEVLTKNSLRRVIPQNSIFRAFGGFKGVLEFQLFTFPMSLTLDEKLMYLADPETVGTIIGSRIDVRRVKGFHHRGVLSFDAFLNQTRRYSFNVTYENGRSTPNFEYLSKISAGFRVVY